MATAVLVGLVYPLFEGIAWNGRFGVQEWLQGQFGAASANSQYTRLITQDAAGISGTIGYLNIYPPTATAPNFIMGAAANWAKLSPEVNRAPVAWES